MCGVLGILFLVIPAVEIYFIIKVGSLLGPWLTLLIIGITAMVGAYLARSQGLAVLDKLKAALAQGQGVGSAIVEGALLLAAGVTLLAPGFLTDAIGISLLVPPLRAAIAQQIVSRAQVRTVASINASAMHGQAWPQQDEQSDPPPPGVIDV